MPAKIKREHGSCDLIGFQSRQGQVFAAGNADRCGRRLFHHVTIDGKIIAGLKVSGKLASLDRLDYDVLTA